MPNNSPWMDHVHIRVKGADLPAELISQLIDVTVDTSLNMPSMVIMRFHDEGFKWIDSGPFDPGAAVEVSFGAAGDAAGGSTGSASFKKVFSGEITAVEPTFTENLSAYLTIRGYDRSHRLSRGTQSKVYVQVSDSDIAQQIAGEAGLQVTADTTRQVYDHVFQHNQTHLAFLQERARRNGFEVFVDDRTIYFRKPKGARGNLTLKWGVGLRSFYPRLTLAGQVNEVMVKGWDPSKKQEIVGKATSSKTAPEITDGVRGGGQVAQQAFQAAKQMVIRQPVVSQAQADALAQSVLDDINAGFVEAEGIATGNPELIAGIQVKLEELGTRFSGKYMVTSANHLYTPENYEVHFRVEGARPRTITDLISEPTAGESSANSWGGVVPAIVTNISDPKDMCRVKVKFPWIDTSLESDWARVSSIGAGPERGIFWMPEVNDEVLVAFEHGDFNRPYIVGSLWNGQDKPPEPGSKALKNGQVEIRTLKTRTGHTIRLVDDSSGEYIEIIDSKTNNQIKLDAKSNKLTIIGKGNIEIEAQSNLDIKAASNLSIKANGNVNVEASGQLVLKGSMVNIN